MHDEKFGDSTILRNSNFLTENKIHEGKPENQVLYQSWKLCNSESDFVGTQVKLMIGDQ